MIPNVTGLGKPFTLVITPIPETVDDEAKASLSSVVFLGEVDPIDPVPQGSISFGAPTITTTSITQPFSYSGSDADYVEYRVNGGTVATVTSPIELTGLSPDTDYTIQARAVNEVGAGAWYEVTRRTLEVIVPPVPQGDISFGTPTVTEYTISQPFSYSGDDADSFEARINGGQAEAVTSPVLAIDLSPDTQYSIQVRALNETGAGSWFEALVSTDSEPLPDPPEGEITFGSPTITHNRITQPFTWTGTGATGFQYRLNEGAWGVTGNPLVLLGLRAETQYTIDVRAVNAGGASAFATTQQTTSEAPPPSEDDAATNEVRPSRVRIVSKAADADVISRPGIKT